MASAAIPPISSRDIPLAADWKVEQIPLVDWLVSKSTPKLGAVQTAAVANPDRELAVWGTDRVFRFPEMLPGLTPGLGHK